MKKDTVCYCTDTELTGKHLISDHTFTTEHEALTTTMKINTYIHPNTTRGEARRYAQEWQAWASEQDLSFGELAEWQAYFLKVAEKFNLTEEFKENGII